jgi:biotin carboxyl carrier protein
VRHPLLLAHGADLFKLVVSGEAGEFIVRRDDGEQTTMRIFPLGRGYCEVICEGQRDLAHYAVDGDIVHVQYRGQVVSFEQRRHEHLGDTAAAGDDLRSPMPGQITSIFVEVGQQVDAGDPLYGLEAMKMETLIKAPAKATVSAINAAAGEQIDGGVIVVELELQDHT